MAQLGSTVVAGSLTVTDDVNLVKPLPIVSGGTGQSTGENACNVLLNSLTTGDSDPVDNDYYIAQYVNGGTTTTTYHRRPVSKLWNYIKGKISSVLGLTVTTYGGNAASATSATSATYTSYLGTSSSNYSKTTLDNALNAKAGTAVATQSSNGLMSSTDKTKLDGIALWEII